MIETIARSIVLALAWFAGVNAIASAISAVGAIATRRMDSLGRPHLLLTIRLFPAFASLLFVGTMFLPAQWAFEPRGADETLGAIWYALAAVGVFLLARSGASAASIARVSRELRLSGPSAIRGAVQKVDDLPGVSLAGVLKPRILVSAQVIKDLSPSELDVAIAHEIAHRDAFDNVARWAHICAPDFLSGSAMAGRLEQGWRDAAEFRADARAARGETGRAVDLASALIKVARLSASWTGKLPAASWSTLHDSALLQLRVERLVSGRVPPPERVPGPMLTIPLCLAATIISLPLLAERIHHLTEKLVVLLP